MDNIFARLEELSSKLNSTSDSISEALKRAESKLATLRLGIEVWLEKPLEIPPILAGEEDRPTETALTYLGYAKVSGTWHVAVKTVWDTVEYEEDDPTPVAAPGAIQQASRETRVAAL